MIHTVALPISLDITTIVDLLSQHVSDLVDAKVDEVFPSDTRWSWTDWNYDPDALWPMVEGNKLIVTVQVDVRD